MRTIGSLRPSSSSTGMRTANSSVVLTPKLISRATTGSSVKYILVLKIILFKTELTETHGIATDLVCELAGFRSIFTAQLTPLPGHRAGPRSSHRLFLPRSTTAKVVPSAVDRVVAFGPSARRPGLGRGLGSMSRRF